MEGKYDGSKKENKCQEKYQKDGKLKEANHKYWKKERKS